jgi:tetratricopeptide (TPR) repeat protein
MAAVTINSLAPQLQKQVESARAALDRGRTEQALELCAAVLALQPDCLQVRKLERAAQLKLAAHRRGLVAKFVSAVSTAPFVFGATMKLQDDPRGALATAERLLRRNAQSVPALNLLGQAATALGWPETAVFAHEAASDLEPERIDLLLALGRAYLAVGRSADAAGSAHQILHLELEHAGAKTLLQHALVASSVVDGKWTQDRTRPN